MDEHQFSHLYLVETSRLHFCVSFPLHNMFMICLLHSSGYIHLLTMFFCKNKINKHMNMMQNPTHDPFFRELLVTEDTLVLMGCQDLR